MLRRGFLIKAREEFGLEAPFLIGFAEYSIAFTVLSERHLQEHDVEECASKGKNVSLGNVERMFIHDFRGLEANGPDFTFEHRAIQFGCMTEIDQHQGRRRTHHDVLWLEITMTNFIIEMKMTDSLGYLTTEILLQLT